MSNLFGETPIYISVSDVNDSTSKAGLKSLSATQTSVLIVKAQSIVDNYILRYGEKFDETQDLIFPIKDDDDASLMPTDIKQATFFIVEQLFENGDSIVESQAGDQVITEEKIGDRTIKYSDEFSATLKTIPESAIVILKKYKKVFYNASI